MKKIIIVIISLFCLSSFSYSSDAKKVLGNFPLVSPTPQPKPAITQTQEMPLLNFKKTFANGAEYESNGKYAEALSSFNDAAKADPDDLSVVKHMGDCEYALQNYSDAIIYYEKYLKSNSKDKKTAQYLAEIQQAIAAGKKTHYSEFIAPYSIKSPASTILFSLFRLLPVTSPFCGGTTYAKSTEMGLFVFPHILSGIGAAVIAVSPLTIGNEGEKYRLFSILMGGWMGS